MGTETATENYKKKASPKIETLSSSCFFVFSLKKEADLFID
jgi:hypothetical protein